jgi:hypothetical protein
MISVLLAGNACAQEQLNQPQNIQNQSKEGSYIWQRLDIESNPVIVDLLQKQYDQSKKNSSFPGYRVQIFFGSGTTAHSKAEKIKADFSTLNPGIKAYLIFKSPDFIVRIGDYRTKSEALKMQKSLLATYPGSFIVADEIALPDLVGNTAVNY